MKTASQMLAGYLYLATLTTAATVQHPSSSVTAKDTTCTDEYTKTKAKCTTTQTFTTSVAKCVTKGSTETVTNLDNATVIEADTLTSSKGTAIATVSVTTTKTQKSSSTLTSTLYPTVKVGTDKTVTAAPPKGFLPIQSSLPNATYHLSGCDTKIKTEIHTVTGTSPPKSTTTFTGIVIASAPSGNLQYTYYSASDFTGFPIKYTTKKSTTTVYPGTTTKVKTFSSTVTESATTTTIYNAACASNNIADGIAVTNGKTKSSEPFNNGFTSGNGNFVAVSSADGSPEACCQAAFEQDAQVWFFREDPGTCHIFVDGEASCPNAPVVTFTAVYSSQLVSPGIVLGNGPCGQWQGEIEESTGIPPAPACS